MRILQTLFLSALLLSVSMLTNACVNEEIGVATNSSISGRPFFEVWKANDGEYYFHLSASNDEIVLSSEGYTSRTGALNGILSVLKNGVDSERYEIREASNGEHYFVLKAGNGRIIGMSELYSNLSNAERGAATTAEVTQSYNNFVSARKGARFTFFTGTNGLFYFNLRAQNGEIVLQSQGYKSAGAALNGGFAVAQVGLRRSNYKVRTDGDGGTFFTLMANNGQVIGTSEIYRSRSNARSATDAIIGFLPTVELL